MFHGRPVGLKTSAMSIIIIKSQGHVNKHITEPSSALVIDIGRIVPVHFWNIRTHVSVKAIA